MRDSDLEPARSLPGKKILLAGAAAAVLLTGLAAWWMMAQKTEDITSDLADVSGQPSRMPSSSTRGQGTENSASPAPPLTRGGREGLGGVDSEPKPVQSQVTGTANSASAAVGAQPLASLPDSKSAPAIAAATGQAASFTAVPASPAPPLQKYDKAATGTAMTPPPAPPAGNPVARKAVLFEQRLAAGRQLLEQNAAVASIQLFYNEEINPERIEGFLMRADKLGKLHEIYLLPTKFGSKDGIRVLYGAYPSVDAARKATGELPQRYREAFATSIHIF